jgi:predicted nucleotidyltransferase
MSGASQTRLHSGVFRFVEERIESRGAGVAYIAVFARIPGANALDEVWRGSTTWGDYDNTGTSDVLITGSLTLDPPYEPITKIYATRNGFLVQDVTNSVVALPAVYNSDAQWGDFDSDGDLDIALIGHDGTERIARVFRNDNGVYIDIEAQLPGVENGSVTWGDYDADGDLDLIITGTSDHGPLSEVFRNDNGLFTSLDAPLPGVFNGTAQWGDYDADGDLDILLIGGVYAPGLAQGLTRVYRNDGGIFNQLDLNLAGLSSGTAKWGDFDGDGDLDILLVGPDVPLDENLFKFHVYENRSGDFFEIEKQGGIQQGRAVWFDYQQDGDLDVLMAGIVNGAPGLFLLRYP